MTGAVLGSVVLPGAHGTELAAAAVLAWLAQAGSSGVRIRLARRPERWMAAWVWGSAFRVLAVALATGMVVWRSELGALPTLVGLVAFLFTMMLLEPLVLDLDPASRNEPR